MKLLALFLVFALINFGALGLGSWLMGEGPSSSWYQELNKAPWTPPGWVFGLAWTLIMICYSLYLALLFSKTTATGLIVLYAFQLVTNISWNYFFFNRHWMLISLVVLIALTLLIWFMFFKFKGDMNLGSHLLAPYMLWLLVACSLNAFSLLKN